MYRTGANSLTFTDNAFSSFAKYLVFDSNAKRRDLLFISVLQISRRDPSQQTLTFVLVARGVPYSKTSPAKEGRVTISADEESILRITVHASLTHNFNEVASTLIKAPTPEAVHILGLVIKYIVLPRSFRVWSVQLLSHDIHPHLP